jgi:hypothetical protein
MVGKMEFVPAKIDGKPVAVRVIISSWFGYDPGPSDVICGGCPIGNTIIMKDGNKVYDNYEDWWKKQRITDSH